MTPILIYMTALKEQAEGLCTGLLEAKLIACANILPPHKAMYMWDGTVQNHENECAVIMKSTDDKFEAIEVYVLEHHDYEVPCLVHVDITGGHDPFLEWVKGETVFT